MVPTPLTAAQTLLRLAGIGGVLAIAAGGFAWAGGWFSPERLSPERIVDALSHNGGEPVGHRRNHAKGICVTGRFEASGAGERLSTAPMLARGSYPVIGRFAIAVADPHTADAASRVRSMALQISAPDGQQWRTGINDMPFFVVRKPEAFLEQLRAFAPDAATGKPDPQAVGGFIAAHPEFARFVDWAKSAPWTASFADRAYNSLNAFIFTDAAGADHLVRWTMNPTVPETRVSAPELAAMPADFLASDLKARLAQGPLRWTLTVTIAEPGDPSSDPTVAWPAERQTIDVGTLVITAAQGEADGPCRDITFDPLVLPQGIRPSDDPILLARSPAYMNSFARREAEVSHDSIAAAVAKGE
jgi:catalase